VAKQGSWGALVGTGSQCSGYVTYLHGSGSEDLLTFGSKSGSSSGSLESALFVGNLQDATKNSFFAFFFLKLKISMKKAANTFSLQKKTC
jgi:hypothetical protein